MENEAVAIFLSKHASSRRRESSLERLRSGTESFELRMVRDASGSAAYRMSHSLKAGVDDRQFDVERSHLARVLRGTKPFIPALLERCGEPSLAAVARGMSHPPHEPSFLYDALVLARVRLSVQFDWADAIVPDGFKLSAQFEDQQGPTFYELHNDVVALSVEEDRTPLEFALAICPRVIAALGGLDPEVQAAFDKEQLSATAMPLAVSGHKHRL